MYKIMIFLVDSNKYCRYSYMRVSTRVCRRFGYFFCCQFYDGVSHSDVYRLQ